MNDAFCVLADVELAGRRDQLRIVIAAFSLRLVIDDDDVADSLLAPLHTENQDFVAGLVVFPAGRRAWHHP